MCPCPITTKRPPRKWTHKDLLRIACKLDEQEKMILSLTILFTKPHCLTGFLEILPQDKRALLFKQITMDNKIGNFADLLTPQEQTALVARLFGEKKSILKEASGTICTLIKDLMVALTWFGRFSLFIAAGSASMGIVSAFIPVLIPFVVTLITIGATLGTANLLAGGLAEATKSLFIPWFGCAFDPDQVRQDAIQEIELKLQSAEAKMAGIEDQIVEEIRGQMQAYCDGEVIRIDGRVIE